MGCQEACFSGRSLADASAASRSQNNFASQRYRHRHASLNTRAGSQCFASSSIQLEGPVIGIDLGTSNSAVAAVVTGSPVVIPVEAGKRTLPSVICLGKDPDDAVIGSAAQQAASSDPLNTFSSVKRLIGRTFANCYREAGSLVYKLVEGPQGETLLWSPAKEEAFSPEQVSAMILKHLIGCAVKYLGTDINGAVIAVPAHFDGMQRQATLRAAHMAGLKHVQLLQEPVAAAMAYGLHHNQEEEAILVFDLGGGTYDVSLLEGFEGIFEVLATGGDSRLGGDDWDSAIVDWCLQQCRADLRAEIRGGRPELLQQLHESARLAKVQLSTATETTVHVPSSKSAQGPSIPLSRKEMEQITRKLRLRLGPPLERLGKECHVQWAGSIPTMGPALRSMHISSSPALQQQQYAPKPRRISQVVLVGSATRIPSVRKLVKDITGIEPCSWVNPEECVALGAAIQAGILIGGVAGMELADGSYKSDLHQTASGFQGLPVA